MNLGHRELARIAAVNDELDTVHLGERRGIELVLPEITALVGLEGMLVYSLKATEQAYALERWQQHNIPATMTRLGRAILTSMPKLLFYDLQRPEPSQRNRAVEATAWIDRTTPGTWEQSVLCQRVFVPSKVQHHRQLRVLICEGSALLGWLGGIQANDIEPRQRRVLTAFVPAMRRRLSLERRLDVAPRAMAALAAALEQLGAPAFVIDARGRVHETNAAAAVMLAQQRSQITLALRDAAAHPERRSRFELIELHDRGMPRHYLAIARAENADAHLDARVHAAATRWQLTPRQTQVLALLVRGQANATIAANLDIGDRAVELHVTALFDRVGVDNRSALVARVLTT